MPSLTRDEEDAFLWLVRRQNRSPLAMAALRAAGATLHDLAGWELRNGLEAEAVLETAPSSALRVGRSPCRGMAEITHGEADARGLAAMAARADRIEAFARGLLKALRATPSADVEREIRVQLARLTVGDPGLIRIEDGVMAAETWARTAPRGEG